MAKFSIRKWAKVCVALGGVAFSATAAQAGDPCACAPVVDCCTPSDCCDVASELCALTEDCCADACDGCADEGCSILGGLFDRFSCHNDGCDACDIIDDCCADACDGCADDGCGIDVGGWLQAGYHNRNNGLFNNHNDRFNVHQAWLYAEKVADGSDGIGFGGRVDFMYGVDSGDTNSFGNNPGEFDLNNAWSAGFGSSGYGFAMPQLYAEVAYGDLSVIAGHFYTLLGYEVVTAPDNFFYSHAYTMFNSEAFTHTGVLATYAASDNLTLYAGWTLGWDTGFDQRFGGSNFLGGYSVGLGDNASFTHIITAGDFGNIGDGFSQSLVLDVAVTDNLNYVVQSDILRTNGQNSTNNDTIGINQYLLYTVSDKIGVGARAEWWKTDGTSIYAMTAGLNIRPMDNVIIRPEIRFDWEPGGALAGNTPLAADIDGRGQFGVDVILTF